jgi:hypothetical protein
MKMHAPTLTPALSHPMGEGELFAVFSANTRLGWSDCQQKIASVRRRFPLLWGEGQGEGRQTF